MAVGVPRSHFVVYANRKASSLQLYINQLQHFVMVQSNNLKEQSVRYVFEVEVGLTEFGPLYMILDIMITNTNSMNSDT